jgi:hypothetical protein
MEFLPMSEIVARHKRTFILSGCREGYGDTAKLLGGPYRHLAKRWDSSRDRSGTRIFAICFRGAYLIVTTQIWASRCLYSGTAFSGSNNAERNVDAEISSRTRKIVDLPGFFTILDR